MTNDIFVTTASALAALQAAGVKVDVVAFAKRFGVPLVASQPDEDDAQPPTPLPASPSDKAA